MSDNNRVFTNGDLVPYLFDMAGELNGAPEKSRIVSLGITGRAGAGKSTFVQKVDHLIHQSGQYGVGYHIDWDFLHSSAERKQWIAEGLEMGVEEYLFRSNQVNWWNFDRTGENVGKLKHGEMVSMDDAYDKQSGQKDGQVKLGPLESPARLYIEGCFIADPKISQHLDLVAYFYVDPQVGFQRTWERDRHRKNFYDFHSRWSETTRSEDQYLAKHLDSIADKLVVIDNNDFGNRQIIKTPDQNLSDELRERLVPGYDRLVFPVTSVVAPGFAGKH